MFSKLRSLNRKQSTTIDCLDSTRDPMLQSVLLLPIRRRLLVLKDPKELNQQLTFIPKYLFLLRRKQPRNKLFLSIPLILSLQYHSCSLFQVLSPSLSPKTKLSLQLIKLSTMPMFLCLKTDIVVQDVNSLSAIPTVDERICSFCNHRSSLRGMKIHHGKVNKDIEREF